MYLEQTYINVSHFEHLLTFSKSCRLSLRVFVLLYRLLNSHIVDDKHFSYKYFIFLISIDHVYMEPLKFQKILFL